MADLLSTITTFINSPPGQLVAGGVLATIVWKFFERIEAVLTDDTKLEMAVWLLGVKTIGPKMEPWPETFAKVFDRVFGGEAFVVEVLLAQRGCLDPILVLHNAFSVLATAPTAFVNAYLKSPDAIWYYPAFFTSIWLWLYAGSGFLLKFARRFDKSLGWFNRRFDIEKHPLSSIGLVAGVLVALFYWAAVIVSRVA